MSYFAVLLEQGFKKELLKLQQELIDDLPDNYDITVINTEGHEVDNGLYLTVHDTARNWEWSLKPSDFPKKAFLLVKNQTEWEGPHDYDALIRVMTKDMSESTYRATIVDDSWFTERR